MVFKVQEVFAEGVEALIGINMLLEIRSTIVEQANLPENKMVNFIIFAISRIKNTKSVEFSYGKVLLYL